MNNSKKTLSQEEADSEYKKQAFKEGHMDNNVKMNDQDTERNSHQDAYKNSDKEVSPADRGKAGK